MYKDGKYYNQCRFCGEPFERKKSQPRLRVCDDPGCQLRKHIRRKKQLNECSKRSQRSAKLNFDKSRKAKTVCRRCGEDPKPNYFYCNPCLAIMSDRLSGPEDVYWGCDEIKPF